MPMITLLSSEKNRQLCKFFVQRDGVTVSEKKSPGTLFTVEEREVSDLGDLSGLLTSLENDHQTCVIRGRLRKGHIRANVQRTKKGANPPFEIQPCQWLCVDIDELKPLEGLPHYNVQPEIVARFAALHLPPEFEEVDFHWRFSGSMGVEVGIRIHLWFWLSRPISDLEAKAWLSTATTKIDPSLFDPIQLHYTANPIFRVPAADPVKKRSGLFEFGKQKKTVEVPENLSEFVKSQIRPSVSQTRSVNHNRIDANDIVRDEKGLVIDGRNTLIFLKCVDACRELTAHKSLPKGIPSVDELAHRTWELFSNEACLDDGKWTERDARQQARYRIEEMEGGWVPNDKHHTTSLVSGVKPSFDFTSVPKEDGIAEFDYRLDQALQEVIGNAESKSRIVLRVTMGAGKTTLTVERLKTLLDENPTLNIEYYVPRHDLAAEIIDQFKGLNPHVDLIHMRGRTHDMENGNALCTRPLTVKSLEDANVSVRTQACWRSETEVCKDYDTCAYFRQFRGTPGKSGAVRVFQHAHLRNERIDSLPDPDLVIIDEAFLNSVLDERSISETTLRPLLNAATDSNLGDELLNALRDRRPVLKELRNQGWTTEKTNSINIEVNSPLPFNGSSNASNSISAFDDAIEGYTARKIIEILAEELELEDREHVSRLRYDPGGNVVVNFLQMDGIVQDPRLLFLDATADQLLLEHLFGEIAFHRIDIDQQAVVTQVFNRTGSKKSWSLPAVNDDQADETEEPESGFPERLRQLLTILKSYAAFGSQVLFVSHKALADRVRELELPEEIKIAHFQNLRGIDDFKNCDAVFITGRNQPPFSAIDGMARAIWWNDDKPLQHDEAALLGSKIKDKQMPTDLRGYSMVNPTKEAGVYVYGFSDSRIEALNHQFREAETVQAIARLRMVHADYPKEVFLLSNLPIEIPIDEVISWENLLPSIIEEELIERGNAPLGPKGLLKMRPDLAPNEIRAKNLSTNYGINEDQYFLRACPYTVRISCQLLEFKEDKNGEPFGRTYGHLFLPTTRRHGTPYFATGHFDVEEAYYFLQNGDPEIDGSGWGRIHLENRRTWAKESHPDAVNSSAKDLEDYDG